MRSKSPNFFILAHISMGTPIARRIFFTLLLEAFHDRLRDPLGRGPATDSVGREL